MPRINRKKNARFPQIKREIKDFMLSEEGRISKKDIAKLGLSLAILGVTLEPQSAQAAHASHTSHSNGFFVTGKGGHSSGTTHSSAHANHGNHSSGGWC